MKPVYSIIAGGEDIAERIGNRLISITVTDETGYQSDRIEIELDDRGNPFEMPAKGAELDVRMGFEKDGKQTLQHMGVFLVDEVSVTGPPDKMIISGRAANMTASLKVKKTREWDNVTLSDIVSTIAKSHDLTPVVGSGLATISFEHLDQTQESDLHFLTRLGREHDAVAKPVFKRLLMVKKGEAKSASGKSLPTVSITRADFVDPGWEMQAPDRGKYKAVTAYYQDIQAGEKIPVTVGSGDPVYIIRSPFSNQALAEQAASSRLDKLERGTSTLRGHVSPRGDLIAEGRIEVTGIRPGVNGLWSLTKVTTKIDENGFSISFDAEVPKI